MNITDNPWKVIVFISSPSDRIGIENNCWCNDFCQEHVIAVLGPFSSHHPSPPLVLYYELHIREGVIHDCCYSVEINCLKPLLFDFGRLRAIFCKCFAVLWSYKPYLGMRWIGNIWVRTIPKGVSTFLVVALTNSGRFNGLIIFQWIHLGQNLPEKHRWI